MPSDPKANPDVLHVDEATREPAPDPRAQPFEGDDPLGVWVAICPKYGWDHAAVYNDPMAHVNCPHCWRFWGKERPCEIRQYKSEVVRTLEFDPPITPQLTHGLPLDITERQEDRPCAAKCGRPIQPGQLYIAKAPFHIGCAPKEVH